MFKLLQLDGVKSPSGNEVEEKRYAAKTRAETGDGDACRQENTKKNTLRLCIL